MRRKHLGLGVAAPGRRVSLWSSFAPAAVTLSLAAALVGASLQAASATEVACDPNSANTTCPNGSFGGIVDGSGFYSNVAGTNASGGGNLGATVFGSSASATGNFATAIGVASSAAAGSVAIGSADPTTPLLATLATGLNSIAVGTQANALGEASIAQGLTATATGVNDIAIGNGAAARSSTTGAPGLSAIAIGANSVVTAPIGSVNSGVAVGYGANATTTNIQASSPVAIGYNADATGAGAQVAIGDRAVASGTDAIGIGGHAGTTGVTASGNQSIAVGQTATSSGDSSVAIGNGVTASGIGSLAFGNNATASVDGGIALGTNSTAARAGLAGAAEAFSGTPVASTQGALSVGAAGAERQITNVAGGTQATDAVNVRQLQAVGNNLAGSLGGGAAFDPTTGAYTAPTYTIGGTNYDNVGGALGALAAGAGSSFASDNTANAAPPVATGANASAGGYGASATGAGSTVVGNGATDNGNGGAVVVGNNASALGAGAIAIGQGTTASTSVSTQDVADFRNPGGPNKQINNLPAGTTTFVPTGTAIGALSTVGNGGGVAIGYNNNAGNTVQNQVSTAIGANNLASGVNSIALGLNNTASNRGSIAIGTDSQSTGLRAIAMGREAYAYGDFSTAQGYLASAYGANALAFGPNSVAGVNGGAAANDVAIGSGATSTLGNSVALGAGSVASRGAEAGYAGYAVGATTSVGEVAVGTAANARTLTGVAAGRVATDAVNVSQLQAVGNNLAGSLGGGAAFDPTTGAFTAPAYAVGNQTYGNVGAALAAGNALAVQYTPDATGAPTNAVDLTKGGTLAPVALTGLANATTATGAVALGQVPMQYSTAAAPTTANPAVPSNDVTLVGANAGAPVALHNVDAGALTAASTDAVNGSQLYATNQQVTAITNGTAGLVQQAAPGAPITVGAGTDGTSVGFANNAGAARTLTGVAAGQVAAGSTQATNGGQLYGTAASVANALGGGAGVNADGTVSAPTYNVANGSYNNVGAALTALNDGIAGGTLGAFTSNNAANAPTPVSSGANASAGGFGASATGAGSTVIGNASTDNGVAGAAALGSNASVTQAGGVALGSGSTATRAGLAGAAEAFSGTAVASTQGAVSVGAAGAERQITNVAGGTQDTDAVNVRQLRSVGSNLAGSLGGGAGFDAATGAYTAPAYAVGGQTYDNVGAAIAAGNALGVQYTPDAAGAPTAAVDLTKGGTLAPVALTGLANATTGTGAVALAQMPMQYSTAAAPTTANPAVPSNDVTLVGANAAAPVSLHNLAAGALTATSTDAVNGSQLYATNQQIAALAGGTAGLVQQDPATRAITVGAGTDGDTVGFTNNAGAARTLTGVAGGQVAAGSTQAVNGDQLYGVTTQVASLGTQTATAIGGGASYTAAGGLVGPSYKLNGSGQTYTDLVAGQQALANGAAGPVQYSTPGTPSNAVNLVGAGGAVTLGNVAAGQVARGSTQAINGGQLQGTAASVASALGGGAQVTQAGTVSAPRYNVNGANYNNVGSAIDALQSGMTTSLANLQTQITQNDRRLSGGIASAIAGTGLRYDDRPGKWSTAAGFGGYRGEFGFAGGLGYTSEDQRWRVNAALTLAPTDLHTDVGAVGAVSYTLN